MVGSFSWGLIRLLRTLQMEDRGFSDWSFGQVVPLVLLAAPLLTIFESFYTVHQPNNTVSTALMQFHTSYSEFDHDNSLSNTPLQARDHPDQDFYQNSSWAHSLIHLMVAFAIGETTWILTLGSLGDYNFLRFVIPKDPTFFSSLVSYFPIYITLCIWILIMVLILLEDIGCAPGNVLRSFIGIPRKTYILGGKVFLFGSSVAGSILSWTVPEFGGIIPSSLFCLFSNAVLYCVLSAVVHLTTVRHGYAFL
ncbi:hypothetical protein CUC08_Gglean004606 [Alternaria sp. MG1]|nr:hypothetical protein CUC08_Gglean004606 [Alternaria sp. MG1]